MRTILLTLQFMNAKTLIWVGPGSEVLMYEYL